MGMAAATCSSWDQRLDPAEKICFAKTKVQRDCSNLPLSYFKKGIHVRAQLGLPTLFKTAIESADSQGNWACLVIVDRSMIRFRWSSTWQALRKDAQFNEAKTLKLKLEISRVKPRSD